VNPLRSEDRNPAEMRVRQSSLKINPALADGVLSWPQRRAWLCAFRRVVAAHARDMARLISSEIGKPEGEAYVSEILPLLAAISWHLRHAEKLLRVRRVGIGPLWMLGRSVRVGRAPLGSVLLIATWNYPIGLLGVQLVQAITAGNRVIVKPSERSPASQHMLVRCAASCGLPKEWITVADATAHAGALLVREGAYDKVLFTGGALAGASVARDAALALKPSVLELSGHDTALVMADADAKRAAQRIWLAISMNAGQTCMAPRRVLVHRSVYHQFLAALAPLAAEARPQRLVCDSQALHCERLVQDALANGARSVSGVAEPARDGWIRPLAIVDCPVDVLLSEGAHFGPVIAVMVVENLEQALRIHAAGRHRLAVSVYTRSPGRWQGDANFIRQLDASVITFNESVTPTGHPAISIAGLGASGWGASRGAAGLLELTRPISISITAAWTPAAVAPTEAQLLWLDRMVRWWNAAKPAKTLAILRSPMVATPREVKAAPTHMKECI